MTYTKHTSSKGKGMIALKPVPEFSEGRVSGLDI
jgi:hypothetical protein